MNAIHIRPSSKAEKWAAKSDSIMTVRRHWFGFFALVAMALALMATFAAIMIFVPFGETSLVDRIDLWLILVLMSLVGAALFMIIWQIYFSNHLVLTSDMVSQKMQLAIFKRKQSQLGLANIEDVTVTRNGVAQTLMNFGTLTIETAGEQNNFDFRYCPDPERCAKIIMAVRADFLADNPDVTAKLR